MAIGNGNDPIRSERRRSPEGDPSRRSPDGSGMGSCSNPCLSVTGPSVLSPGSSGTSIAGAVNTLNCSRARVKSVVKIAKGRKDPPPHDLSRATQNQKQLGIFFLQRTTRTLIYSRFLKLDSLGRSRCPQERSSWVHAGKSISGTAAGQVPPRPPSTPRPLPGAPHAARALLTPSSR